MMRERVRRYDQRLLDELSEILKCVESEWLRLEGFAEALEIFGVLPEVLERWSSVNAFLDECGISVSDVSTIPAMQI